MATREQTYITTVELNGKKAEEELKKLQKIADDTRVARDKALATGDKELGKKLEKEFKKAEKAVKMLKMQTSDFSEILNNISDSSIQQLSKAAKALNSQIKHLAPNTEEFKQKAEQLSQIRTRLAELRAEGNAQQGWLQRMFDGLNRNWGAFTQIIGAVTGLTMTIRKSVQDYADMEEAMADVQKYTGMTTEEVHEMNEELKAMDTRTPREKLNALAGDAGRLGITGKEQILEFVDAANKINVALGDDLGESAVRDIGKLADTFGDSEKMGLRGAMLATGSAVNQLAQSSSAAAGYIVEFEARLGGAATQAGIAQTAIMGYASVLDQNMQQQETSATAMSQLITAMFKDPAKFAKLAGQDVKSFTDLLKKDANAAILQFLGAMQKKGGFDALAPMFDEMGLSGSRCVGVLSTLATHLGDVKTAQEIAQKAFEEGTSVLEECAVQEGTVQAQIDNAKKSFLEVSIALGEKLLPVVRYTISGSALLVKGLNTILEVLPKMRATLIAATVALVAWNAAALKALIIEKVTIAVKACRTAVIALNAALKANPWGIALTVITMVGAAIWDYFENTEEATKATDKLTAAQKRLKEGADSIAKETEKLKAKFTTLQTQWKNLSSVADKTKWIKDNQSAFHELGLSIKNVNDAENALVKNSAAVIDALTKVAEAAAYTDLYTKSLENAAEWKRKNRSADGKKINYKYAKVGKYYGDLAEDEKPLVQQKVEGGRNRGAYSPLSKKEIDAVTAHRIQKAKEAKKAEEKEYDDQVKYYKQKMEEAQKASIAAQKSLASANVFDSSHQETEKERKAREKAEKAAERARKKAEQEAEKAEREAIKSSQEIAKQENAINDAKYAMGEIKYKEYTNKKYEIAIAELNRELAIYQEGTDKYNTVRAQLEKMQSEQTLKNIKITEGEILKHADANAIYLQKAFMTPGEKIFRNQLALDEALFQNEYDTIEKRRDLYEKSSEQWQELNDQMETMDAEHKLKKQQDFEQKRLELSSSFRKQYNQELLEVDIAFLEELEKQGLISEKEKQEAIRKLRKEFSEQNKEEKEDPFEFGNFDEMTSGVALMMDAMTDLSRKIKDGAADWKDYAKVGAAALSSVMGLMSAMSNLASATAQAEIATTEAKYKRLIDAAEGNEEEQKRLEERKNKEIKKIKLKQAESERDYGIAQAFINTALGVTKAYAEYEPITASILAALTTAMGAMQVATINKQYEAQVSSINSGYYEGGYTGGHRYRKEAGVVHEGEFVANHEAVNNPEIRPMLDLIDQAQRNNTVGSLTADDLRMVGGSTSPQEPPVVNVTNDNSDLRSSIAQINDTMSELNKQLAEGLRTNISMQEFKRQEKHYNQLMNNK